MNLLLKRYFIYDTQGPFINTLFKFQHNSHFKIIILRYRGDVLLLNIHCVFILNDKLSTKISLTLKSTLLFPSRVNYLPYFLWKKKKTINNDCIELTKYCIFLMILINKWQRCQNYFFFKQDCVCIAFLSHLLILTFVDIFRQKCVLWSPLGIWFFLNYFLLQLAVYIHEKCFLSFYFQGSSKEKEHTTSS